MEDVNEALREIDDEIRRLKVDFDRFFNGALPFPPEERRENLKRLLRRARGARLKTFADRFLLNTLEARFNTLSELFNRRLREMETSGGGAPRPPRERLDPRSGVVLGRKPDLEAVSALYNQLYSSAGRRAKTDFDSFQSYLRKQIEALHRRTGCEQIRFRVADAKGQPTLKAKPLAASE